MLSVFLYASHDEGWEFESYSLSLELTSGTDLFINVLPILCSSSLFTIPSKEKKVRSKKKVDFHKSGLLNIQSPTHFH